MLLSMIYVLWLLMTKSGTLTDRQSRQCVNIASVYAANCLRDKRYLWDRLCSIYMLELAWARCGDG